MATFEVDGISLYYEDHGSGEPLVVLNGIFMSCASWKAFVPSFSAHNRLLLLDLVDQGASGRLDHEYTQELQERVVLAFLDHLGLDRAHLCGVSYGGEVALRVATRHPDRVRKLVLANTTAYTSAWLRDIGQVVGARHEHPRRARVLQDLHPGGVLPRLLRGQPRLDLGPRGLLRPDVHAGGLRRLRQTDQERRDPRRA